MSHAFRYQITRVGMKYHVALPLGHVQSPDEQIQRNLRVAL